MKRIRLLKQVHYYVYFVFQLVVMLSGTIHANPSGFLTGWGDNSCGQSAPPPKVVGEKITKIAAGNGHNLVLKSDGSSSAFQTT